MGRIGSLSEPIHHKNRIKSLQHQQSTLERVDLKLEKPGTTLSIQKKFDRNQDAFAHSFATGKSIREVDDEKFLNFSTFQDAGSLNNQSESLEKLI